jgi:hypothetical protein
LLESATPREELAWFLGDRAHYYRQARQWPQAIESLVQANILFPRNVSALNTLKVCLKEARKDLGRRKPSTFPEIWINRQRRFPTLPLQVEEEISDLEATQLLLDDPEHDRKWWQPMRQGIAPLRRPVEALVDFTPKQCQISLRFAGSSPAL